MPPRRKSPGPLNTPRTPSGSSGTAVTPPLPSPLSATIRPILRKKKSVTFHPSTKKSASQPNTPKADQGAWTSSLSPTIASPGPGANGFLSDSHPPPQSVPAPAQPPKLSFWSKPRLLDYSHLPGWRRDNAHILSSYRPQSYSHLHALPSLFHLHNESCNIWTHLAGLFFFATFGAVFLTSTLPGVYPQHTPSDWWAFAAFFAGISTCLLASASFHLFHAVGPAEAKAWNGVDYAGIVACIWGSFIACLHFGFDDGEDGHAHLRRAYELMISVLAVLCTATSVLPRFRTPEWRPFRAGMFVAMGLSAVAPVGHGVVLYGLQGLEDRMGLSWVVRQGVLYVAGAGLYAARIPERWAPGCFDVWGSSHQIFHVLVVAAAAAHLKGLLLAMEYRHGLLVLRSEGKDGSL